MDSTCAESVPDQLSSKLISSVSLKDRPNTSVTKDRSVLVLFNDFEPMLRCVVFQKLIIDFPRELDVLLSL